MPVSFINEHTAEFILIPRFTKILEQEHRTVVPIYYWASREGSLIARKCMNGSIFLIVAFYARRPKILNPQQEHIEVKFNESLFSHAKLLQEIGVKVFAGVPLISNLKQLNSDSPCSFFSINPNGKECILQLNKTDASTDKLSSDVSKVEPSEILASINEKQTYHYWDQFIEADRKGRYNRHFSSRKGVYGQMYKPVYFLVPPL